MFDSTFSYKSSTPLPAAVDLQTALAVLHDLDTVIHFPADIRSARRIELKTEPKPLNVPASEAPQPGDEHVGDVKYFEVEASLPFVPTRLWAGGVSYQADLVACKEGCDITIHAPGGFTSINHWRLVEAAKVQEEQEVESEDKTIGWSIQIVSDARCNITFAGFVRGTLKGSHLQLQTAFIEKCLEVKNAQSSTAESA